MFYSNGDIEKFIMNRLLSIFLFFFDDIIPLITPSKSSGFISSILMAAANITPVIGVYFFSWNPFIILFIYWFESATIGLMNIIKMIISGAVKDGGFSPEGFKKGIFLSAFFTFHYGIFMLVHGIFLTVFYFMFTNGSLFNFGLSGSAFSTLFSGFIPESLTVKGVLESELFPVIALGVYHIINFIIYFLFTGEYDRKDADDYFTRPYKRIVIMQLTIIFGGFVLFTSGFRNIIFIIFWILLKIAGDLKITASEQGISACTDKRYKRHKFSV